MGCGSTDPLVGGTVESSTIVSSTMSGSTVTDSTLNTANITNLSSIDESSAKTVLDAICALSDSDLQKLADALQPLLSASTTKAPDTDSSSDISTVYYGESSVLLGKPACWLEIGGQKVPAYD